MKKINKILFSILVLALLYMPNNLFACTGSTLAGNLTPTNAWQTISGVQASDRYTFTIGAGEVIIFSFCQGGGTYTNDPRIDIHDNAGTMTYDFNDDHCGYGAEIVWVCGTSGTYSAGFYEFFCLTDGTALGTVAYKLLPTPTEQDCLGARPLCSSFSNHPQSYVGSGHYYDLFNFNAQQGMAVSTNNCPNCLVTGELNDVWYTFTAQTSGNLAFTIDPVDNGDDYDWALYSLNGGVDCFDLINWASYPPVSCNYSYGGSGITGLGAGGSSCVGPVENNLFNSTFAVNAGETYVLTVSNFSSTQNGYSINFGASTATIVDNSAPSMDNLVYSPYCGSSSLTVQFSEAVWCSSVQPADFVLTGPAGTYSIDDTYSIVCTSASSNTYAGTWYDDVWTLQLGDLLSQSGDYVLTLNANSVEDKCTNENDENQLFFTVVGITADVDVTSLSGCGGNCDGEITVSNLAGGTPPYFVDWSGPSGFTSTNQVISNLCLGTYTVTITDSEGICEYVESIDLTGAPPINPTAANNGPVCQGETLELYGGSDDPASTFAWTGPGTYTSSAEDPTRPNADVGMSGTYTLVVTDSYGCTATAQTDAVVYSVTPVSVTSGSPYCEGEDIQLDATTVIGATYAWTGPGTYASADEDPVISNCVTTDAGTYTVVVTDANLCTATANTSITVNPGITATITGTDPLCFGGSDGEMSVNITSGTAPYSTDWCNGSTSNPVTGLSSGACCVTITDAANCNLVVCETLNDPAELVVDITTVPTECGFLEGEIITNASGGTGTLTIDLTEGYSGNHVTGLHPGDYTVTVTDDNGCQEIQTVTVGFFGAGVVNINQLQDILCFGDETAVLEATMSNGTTPFDYEWSEAGETNQVLSGVGAGTYRVSITDTYGCSGEANHEVTQPEVLSINLTHTDVLCRGEANGTATVEASGGVGVYTYDWDNGGNSAFISGLIAGTYSVTVADFNGCSITDYVVVDQPEKIVSLAVTTQDVSCAGRYDGMALATGDGGTPDYTIHWFQYEQFIASGNQLGSLSSGDYSVQLFDSNNCMAESYFSISEPSQLLVSFDAKGVTCKGYNDGYISVFAEGGTTPYQYQWNTGDSLSVATRLTAGQYFITVIDGNGCQRGVGVVVNESTQLCLGIPDAFTPNGDGINDTWIIEYIELYPSAYVNVFNRWGQQMYQGTTDSEFWDGTFNGKFVPAGAYQYVVDLRNGMEPFTGVVVVVY